MRPLAIHTFCSVKGGVGKSTLAVATAKLCVARGGVPVVVDADMLGSSLSDGLDLCAPKVTLRDGLLDLDAPPSDEWYSLADTRKLRYTRDDWLQNNADMTPAPPPAYLNDAFLYPVPDPSRECSVAALLWRHQRDDGVRYLPSSPLREDAERTAPYSLGTISGFGWVRRLSWLIDGLLEQRADITDIVIDLPPGTWGFAHEVMVFLGTLARNRSLPESYPDWSNQLDLRVNPFIVTTLDRNDHVLAFDYFLSARRYLTNIVPLINRAPGTETARERVRSNLPEVLRDLGLEQTLRIVPPLPRSLGRIFVEGDMTLEEQGRAPLIEALRLEATP